MRAIAFLLPVSCTTLVCMGCAGFALTALTRPTVEQRGDIAAAAVIPAALTATPPDRAVAAPAGRWHRAADGLFYVTATVNKVNVRFLVDTGASVTVLTTEDARRVGATLTGTTTTIATVGGNAPMRWAELDQVTLSGQRMAQVSAAVVERSGGVSLMGQNMLRRMKSFSIDGDDLTIS